MPQIVAVQHLIASRISLFMIISKTCFQSIAWTNMGINCVVLLHDERRFLIFRATVWICSLRIT